MFIRQEQLRHLWYTSSNGLSKVPWDICWWDFFPDGLSAMATTAGLSMAEVEKLSSLLSGNAARQKFKGAVDGNKFSLTISVFELKLAFLPGELLRQVDYLLRTGERSILGTEVGMTS